MGEHQENQLEENQLAAVPGDEKQQSCKSQQMCSHHFTKYTNASLCPQAPEASPFLAVCPGLEEQILTALALAGLGSDH